MPVIKFVKEQKEIEVPEGANLRKEAIKAGVNLHQGLNGLGAGLNKVLNCHGLGHCATCRVNVKKGMDNLTPMGLLEKLRLKMCLSYIGNEDKMRLGCQARVQGDVEVESGPEVDLYGENFFS